MTEIILKSRDWTKHPNPRSTIQYILWVFLVEKVKPRGGMFLGNADEVSFNPETGVYTIKWYDSLMPDTYQG